MQLRKEQETPLASNTNKTKSSDNKIVHFANYEKEKKINAAKERVYAAAKNLAW